MTNNKTRRGPNKPEERHERRGKPQERNANHEEPHVERLLSHDVASDVHGPLVIEKSVDESKPAEEEDEGDEQERDRKSVV